MSRLPRGPANPDWAGDVAEAWGGVVPSPRMQRALGLAIQERMQAVVNDRSLSLKDFAEACGLPYRTAQEYVGGKRKPGVESLFKMGAQLRVNLNWLVLGEGPMLVGPRDDRGHGAAAEQCEPSNAGGETQAAFRARIESLIRNAGGVSALARRVGVSETMVRKWRAGADPTRETIIKLASATGVRIAWLVSGTDEAPRAAPASTRTENDDIDTSSREAEILIELGRLHLRERTLLDELGRLHNA